MIPKAYIQAWKKYAPWQDEVMVEQDLLLSKAMIDIFSNDFLKERLAIRGGTALHKLYLTPAPRYSEDIDLVQVASEELRPICDAIREALIWLDESPKYKQKGDNFTFYFRFETESLPVITKKIKVELNCREHIAHLGIAQKTLVIDNPYFTGQAAIPTFHLEELLATKLRALYQRKKGRDLFDLWYAYQKESIDTSKILETFAIYMQSTAQRVTSKMYLKNLTEKENDAVFLQDITELLKPDIEYDALTALEFVKTELVEKITY